MKQKARLLRMLFPLWACSLCWPMSGQALTACRTRNLALELKRVGAASGKLAYFYELTNRGNQACALSGYPSAVALNSKREAVRQFRFEQVRPNAGDPEDWRVRTIRLNSGEHAWFRIETQDGMGLEDLSLCGKATLVRITPPQNRLAFDELFQFVDCVPTAFIYFLEAGTSQ